LPKTIGQRGEKKTRERERKETVTIFSHEPRTKNVIFTLFCEQKARGKDIYIEGERIKREKRERERNIEKKNERSVFRFLTKIKKRRTASSCYRI